MSEMGNNDELVQAAGLAFAFHYHRDMMNAATHAGAPRFSPITFALADGLLQADVGTKEIREVASHAGKYKMDAGR